VIKARRLVVELDGRRVLDGVDVSLGRGEILGLIGPPESGKSVLLKTLAGLIAPASGAVELASADVGMSFQNDALFDAMTVFENVAFPLRRRRVAADEIARRAGARLDDVGLADSAHELPSEISGGMRKRAGIARATVIEPRIGFFDDPIAGLDPLTGARILDLIVALRDRLQMATIIVSNDLPVLLPVCSRVVMLHAGRVVYDGAPDGLTSSPRPEVVQFATGSDSGPL
jgi:phospholipid/cholesterol/gamma-HCH transport system ATP-binding protein